MGPGSPEMEGRGRAVCTWILDGLWCSCYFEQGQYAKEKLILTWKAQWIIGWDTAAREYRAVGVDNNGVAFIFHGTIKADHLVMESIGGMPARLRFTWDARDPRVVTWKNEIGVDGDQWRLIEAYVLHPE